eukprot:11111417-Lingulodinium_polyedra.AAC.1
MAEGKVAGPPSAQARPDDPLWGGGGGRQSHGPREGAAAGDPSVGGVLHRCWREVAIAAPWRR